VCIHSFAVCDQGADIGFNLPHRYPYDAELSDRTNTHTSCLGATDNK
jgi:hypothetical protein